MKMKISLAKKSDLKGINEIYNYYISNTAYTFDINEITVSEKNKWFEQFKNSKTSVCLVGYQKKELVGFVCSTKFREKEAYNKSLETSVYVRDKFKGKGYGQQLMTELIARLRSTDIKNLYALITYPNKPSINLHKDLKYKKVGVLNNVGYKFNKYWSVHIYELKL
tara:strand:- start:386 stop:883 length:498 start_codon:yes stop_codon:yes gene_type:complete